LPAEIISVGGVWPAKDGAPTETEEASIDLAEEVRDLCIAADMHGWRLDRALASLIAEFSRSYLQQLMADGAVVHRGQVVRKPSARVAVGDAVRVELRPTPQAMAFVPQPMALDIVHEDEHLLVINKPAGLVVHPAAGHWSGTLLNGLLAHHAAAPFLPRAGIVHRLDKDTSGLMLVGKSRQAVDALVRAIAAREVRREYLALAQGAWDRPTELDVEQAIGRDPNNRLRMAVLRDDASGAKAARTTIRLLDSNDGACLVACRLHTGRTHQIRVHMAWLGHPLAGDDTYGAKVPLGIGRQALHAVRLQLAHPISGRPLAFFSEPPPDVMDAIAATGLRYNPKQLASS
jgi:23S rRNA pseudouridine1911/1915/1917 synthase